MNNSIQRIGMGLLFGLAVLMLAPHAEAQVLKGLKKAKDTAIQPMKDAQGTVKSATQPVKDARQVTREVTNTPRDISNEVKRTKSEVDRAKSEARSVKQEMEQAKNQVRGNKSKSSQDSTAAKNASTGGNAAQSGTAADTTSDAPPADTGPTGQTATMRSSSTDGSSNNKELNSIAEDKSTGAPADDSYRRVELRPDNSISTGGTEVSASAASAGSRTSMPSRQTADYSGSPAQKALETADYDMETLEELFESAVWTGPEREHTIRSINYVLDQLRQDIDKIKRMDPDRDTTLLERQYRQYQKEFADQKANGDA